MKRKILIMAGYYVPSVKGGGPIQSIKNLVDNFSDEIDFYIVAADRDLGDKKPFNKIKVDEWISVGKATVYYTNYSKLSWKKTEKIINSINYDMIYINSFFSYKDSIVPLLLMKLKRITKRPTLLAPRGQFSPGAIGLKNNKKKLYIKLTKLIGLYKGVVWHATSYMEKKDIMEIFGYSEEIKVASNLTANYRDFEYKKTIKKKNGELKIAFISRIHPKKNLKTALNLLKEIYGEVEFNIYGPIEDNMYWSDCKKVIQCLPENVTVSYRGIAKHNRVINIFNEHHIFLFPTLGENFGHVISEAFIGGCPVILSDQTPWRQLEEQNVGWDINLKDTDKFISALQYCINLDDNEFNILSKRAFEYGKKNSNSPNEIFNSFSLFV